VSNLLNLRFGFSFEDLYQRQGLVRLDARFLEWLQSASVELYNRLMEARSDPARLTRKQQSDLIVDLAPHVEDFLGELFGITAEVRALQARHNALEPLYALKRKFVQKNGIAKVPFKLRGPIAGMDLTGALIRRTTASSATTRARIAARPA
jgi:hypothetical protein